MTQEGEKAVKTVKGMRIERLEDITSLINVQKKCLLIQNITKLLYYHCLNNLINANVIP